jgi:hypothetical protein
MADETSKAPYSMAHEARKHGEATMTIEAAPEKPKTFTDKNLEPGYGEGGANNVSPGLAKPGGSIKPEINATPKMKLPVSTTIKT